MIIEHRHFDARQDNRDGGTWTIKVKHTFTKYPDETSIREPDNEAFGQRLWKISDKSDNSKTLRDDIVAGNRTEAEPTLSSNDISEEIEPSYEAEETRNDNQNTRHEQETLATAEERTDIMGRYTRSQFIAHITEHENYHKGYRFYPGVSSLPS
jgi:hypothetical protein